MPGAIFQRKLSTVADTLNYRLSCRYHHPKQHELRQEFRGCHTTQMKTLLSHRVQRGIQPPKGSAEGEVVVVKALQVSKADAVPDLSEAERISEEEFETVPGRARPHQGDLLLTVSGQSVGKANIWVFDEETPALVDSHVSILRLHDKRTALFWVHYLRSRYGQLQVEREYVGSNTRELYGSQIEDFTIHDLPAAAVLGATETIVGIQEEISKLNATLRRPVEVIDRAFEEFLGFPLDAYQAKAKERQFSERLSTLGSSSDLRCSYRYQAPVYEEIRHFLRSIGAKPIKTYLLLRPVLGTQVTPSEFEDDTELYYVKPAAIRNSEFDPAGLVEICSDLYTSYARRIGLRSGDVLLAAAGEGTIGKVAVFDRDLKCIISQFLMRLRFDVSQVNRDFAAHYMRSSLFQRLLEREKKGMGNMTNIFPYQVESLPIPSIRRERQDEIAAAINGELQALQLINDQIKEKRLRIARVVLDTVIANKRT